MISGVDIMNAPHRTSHPTVWPKHARKAPLRRRRELWRDPLLLTFAACAFMFQLSNAAVLPFAVAAIQAAGLKDTDTLVSIALVVSQGVAALIAPRLGGLAQARGRKLVLLAGFVALAVRCLVLAINGSAASIVACQLLDGISASTVGVMVPLVVADITHRGGRFNLAMGLVGLAMTAGATFSTTIAGFITELWGTRVAFICLALVAAGGCLLVRFVLSETGQQEYGDSDTAAAVGAA
jgi:MFS family permease